MPWVTRLLNTLRRSRLEREIDRELAFHLAERADDLRARGLTPEAASREARLRFGNPIVQAERTRDVDISVWLDALLRTIRHGVRSAVRAPAFSATVVLTLAAGIGANTAVFSAIDAVLLKPLPVPDSGRLVRVLEFVRAESDQDTQIAPGRLEDWAARTTAFDALAGYYVEDVSDTTGALPERIRRAVVSPRFLQVWRVAPVLGRDFVESEYRTGGTPAVLVSDRYWRTRLGADPGALNRVIRIERESFSVVGVLPATFPFPDRAVDVWWPYPIDGPAMTNTARNRRQRWYTGLGRLRADITADQARADLERVQTGLAAEFPLTDDGIAVKVASLKSTIIGDVGGSLWLLYGAVSILLLIACTNMASLWLSRSAHRRDEIGLRFALGASRAAVAAQLLVETAVLASLGAALGLAIASYAAGFSQLLMPNLPRRDEIGLDGRMFAYASAAAVLVTLLCGALPALRHSRLSAAVARSGRSHFGNRQRTQWLLVGVQMTLSIALLVGAGLLTRSADALSRVDPGFDAAGVLALRISGHWGEATDRAGLVGRIDRTLRHLESIPGVEIAATAWSPPGVPRRYQTEFSHVEGGAAAAPILAEWRSVSPTYFETLRIPITGGARCRVSPGMVADLMVNARFVDRFFHDRPAIGAHLGWEGGSLTGRIAGVVGDAREAGIDRDAPPTVYTCDSAPTPFPWILVRTQNDAAAMAGTIRVRLKEIEPTRAMYDAAPLNDRIAEAFTQARTRTALFVAFAAAALLLAGIGIYATLSHAVSLRRREMGLRIALGARRSELVRGLIGQALGVAAAACVTGVALSAGLREGLAGMLFGISPSDPLTYAVAVVLVLGVASIAAVVPALRTTALEPMQILRER